MTQFAARLLYFFASLIGRLPWPWQRRLGEAVASVWQRRDAREARVARVNLALAYPELLPAQREQWQQAIVRTTARQASASRPSSFSTGHDTGTKRRVASS